MEHRFNLDPLISRRLVARGVRVLVRSFRLQALAKNSIKKYSSDFKIASMAADALGLDPFNLSYRISQFSMLWDIQSIAWIPFFRPSNVYKESG